MGADIMKYIGIVALLVFVYLVVINAAGSTKVINSLSGLNTNAILALQGRTPQTAF